MSNCAPFLGAGPAPSDDGLSALWGPARALPRVRRQLALRALQALHARAAVPHARPLLARLRHDPPRPKGTR